MANIKEKIEDKIIDSIALNAEGRLVVFKPEGVSADLVVEKRADYQKKTISLDIFQKSQFAEAKKVSGAEDFYLVFVYFDLIKQVISDDFYVLPSLDIAKASESDLPKYIVKQKDFADFLLEKLSKKEK